MTSRRLRRYPPLRTRRVRRIRPPYVRTPGIWRLSNDRSKVYSGKGEPPVEFLGRVAYSPRKGSRGKPV